MIPSYQNRNIESNGVSESVLFGISTNDTAHIMDILRNTLYSDKLTAVLREYSANAKDAHAEVGKQSIPIKIILPTIMEPTLIIQDYGPGLSHDDVFQVYTQYGASTKRNNNETIGQLGLGSKSGFCYSDSFTIVSCHGGKRRTYVALLDETEKGTCNLLCEEDCGEETGITIQIPVEQEDITEFSDKAKKLFQYFNPKPDINIEIPNTLTKGVYLINGLIDVEAFDPGNWVALMGGIPYNINLGQLTGAGISEDGIADWIDKLSGALYFNIGEVHISASREELKYSKSTKELIVRKFNDLIDEYVAKIFTAIEGKGLTDWEKRLQLQALNKIDIPIPDEWEDLVKHSITIQEPEKLPKTFTIVSKDKYLIRHLNINALIKLFIKDDDRKIDGFRLPINYLIQKNDVTVPWEIILQELNEYLKELRITGIPLHKLSEQPWSAPYIKSRSTKYTNVKHFRRSFVLKPDPTVFHTPWSQAWDIADRKQILTQDDVFVILDGFKTVSEGENFDIYPVYRRDKKLADFFKIPMPPIYGYKTTKNKPIKTSDCIGIHYKDWQVKFMGALLTPKIKKLVEVLQWQSLIHFYPGKEPLKAFEALGNKHLISQALRKIYKASNIFESHMKGEKNEAFQILVKRMNRQGKSEAQKAIDNIYLRYPLLSIHSASLRAIWGNDSDKWIEYVKLVDNSILPVKLISTITEQENDENI